MQIEIRDMNIPMRIGILPEERLGPQMVVIDAKVAFKPSSEEDRISSVVDTRQVRSRLLKVASTSHYDLQETFVRAACVELLNMDCRVESVEVSLSKPSAYQDCVVSVSEILFSRRK